MLIQKIEIRLLVFLKKWSKLIEEWYNERFEVKWISSAI